MRYISVLKMFVHADQARSTDKQSCALSDCAQAHKYSLTLVFVLLVPIMIWQEMVRHMIGRNGHEVHNQLMGDGTAERPIVFPTASMRSAGVKQGMRHGSGGKLAVPLASERSAGVQILSTVDLGPPPPRISKLNSQQHQHRWQPDDYDAASVRSTGIHKVDSDSEIDFGPPPPRISKLPSNSQQHQHRWQPDDYDAASVRSTGIHKVDSDSEIDFGPPPPRISKLPSQQTDVVVGPPPPRISKVQTQQQQQRKHDHPSVSVQSKGSQETDSDVELLPLPPRISELSSQHQENPVHVQRPQATPLQLPRMDDNQQQVMLQIH